MDYMDDILDLMDSVGETLEKGKRGVRRLLRGESGFGTLAIVLAILALGSLIITPLLVLVITGQGAGETHERVTNRYYAADTGIQDAMWRISANELPDWMMGGTWDVDVYQHAPYTYSLPNRVNGCDVTVEMKAQWLLEGLETLPKGNQPHQEWVTFSNEASPGHYEIVLLSDPTKNLKFERVGCWLPSGFEYVTGSSNLEGGQGSGIISSDPEYVVPTVTDFRGGHVIIWDWTKKGAGIKCEWNDLPLQSSDTRKVIKFQYTPGNSTVDWTWSWSRALSADIAVSWSGDVKLFQLEATGTDPVSGRSTTVIAGNMTNDSLSTGKAMYGDYVVAGNTLMTDPNKDKYRDRLYLKSPGTVSGLVNATPRKIVLYWSGWKEFPNDTFYGDSADLSTWTAGELASLDALAPNYRVDHVSVSIEYDNGKGNNTYSLGTVEATEYTILPNGSVGSPKGWSYSCQADITYQVKALLGANFSGNAKYWVGHAEMGGEEAVSDKTVQGIWGANSDNVFVVGDSGTVLRYNGDKWSIMGTPNKANLKGVWGTSKSNVFAVGDSGTIIYYNGSTWSSKTSGTNRGLKGIWGSSANNIWAVGAKTSSGDHYTLLHSTDGGSSWSNAGSSMSNGVQMNGIWGTADASYVIAVGASGRILWNNGGSGWGEMDEPAGFESNLYGVWGAASDNVFAVGAGGAILHYNGASWSTENSTTTETLYGVWGVPGGGAYAAGANGTILYYDGSKWTQMTSSTAVALYGSWGTAMDNAYCVGQATGTASTILHYNGATWEPQSGVFDLYGWPGSTKADETAFRLGDTGDEWSYAGWSILTVYTSPQTLAHQIYLFDTFRYWNMNQNESFTITGFLAPQGIASEADAVKLTCFVAEGDVQYTGDNIWLNSTQLNIGADAGTPSGNVWNSISNSTGSTADGIDLDTFKRDGSTGIIQPGASSATVRLATGDDSWNLVYMVLSFRSDVTASGLLTYIVK